MKSKDAYRSACFILFYSEEGKSAVEPQSNDYRETTEIVQHFRNRGSSHRRKSAARHKFDMHCNPFLVS